MEYLFPFLSFSMMLLSIHFSPFTHKVYLKRMYHNKYHWIESGFKHSMLLIIRGTPSLPSAPHEVNSAVSPSDQPIGCYSPGRRWVPCLTFPARSGWSCLPGRSGIFHSCSFLASRHRSSNFPGWKLWGNSGPVCSSPSLWLSLVIQWIMPSVTFF